jgi:NRPS condensation-like uncharacterized protein
MLRTLSNLESFYVDKEISIVTVSDLTGTINPLILQKAVEAVVTMHPLLFSEIQKSEQEYFFFERTDFNDKLTVIGEVNKDKRKEIILSELNKPLSNNSLIRFTLLLENRIGILKSQAITFITTTHHAVSDGISCIALQEQIWKMYADLADNQSPTLTPYPLMPAIENVTPTFTDAELTDYIARYNHTISNHNPFAIKPADIEDKAIEIHYVLKKFTLKQTKAILEHCKAHNASVHSVISAANLLAMKDLFGENGQLNLSCHSPINVRPYLTPTIDNNALFSAAIGCTHFQNVTSEMSIWTLANNISDTIKNHIANGDIFKSILTYKETRLKSNLAVSIGITNVGKVKLAQRFRKLKLESINFIPRIPLPMLSACVVTSGDKLTITYPYAKPFYSGNVIKKIAEQTAQYLLNL